MFSGKMRWKLILAVLVIIAIIAAIFFTQTGLSVLGFLKDRISETSSFIFRTPPGNAFPVVVTVDLKDKNSFYGQSYSVSDSTFTATSEYSSIQVDDGKETLADNTANIILKKFSGTFEITSSGILRLSGNANYIKINDNERTRENPYKIDIEATTLDCTPCSFVLENLVSSMSFPSISGEVKKLKADGSVDQIKYLTNEKLDIQNFNGVFQLTNDTLILTGMTNQIRGENFNF
jgi:hypothetical protein